MARFSDQSALVTGAASGIGLATAIRLAADGVGRLILADIDAAGLAEAQAQIARDGLVIETLPGDIADPAYWAAAAPILAGITLAVANAGVTGMGAIVDLDFAEWRRVLSVNLDGAFLTVQAAMRALIAGERGGAIVLTGSVSGIKAQPSISAYAASKAGVMHLASVAATEGFAHRIRVNAIAPGGVETPIWRGTDFFPALAKKSGSEAAAFTAIGAATPLGRFARAEEIAAQIAFLLSDDAATMTGSVLVADGGYRL